MQHKNYTKGIASEIKKELKDAKESIVVSVPWFTDSSIFLILKEKAKCGVGIRILIQEDAINNNADFDIKDLANYNAIIFWNTSKYRLSHRKFCVIDSRIVIKGSYNWTKKARSNEEEIDIFYSRELALEQLETFEASIRNTDVKRYDNQILLENYKKEKKRSKHVCKILKFKDGEKVGFKNEYGDIIIPAIYDEATDFIGNWYKKIENEKLVYSTEDIRAYIWVKKNSRWGVLDNYNNQVVLDGYNECFAFSDFCFAFSHSFNQWSNSIVEKKYHFICHRGKWGLVWIEAGGLPIFFLSTEFESIRQYSQNGRCFIFHRKEKHHYYKISYFAVDNNNYILYLRSTDYEFKSIVPLGSKIKEIYTYFKVSTIDNQNRECYGLLKAEEYNENDYDHYFKTLDDRQLQFSIQIKPTFASLKQMLDNNKNTFFEATELSNPWKAIRINLKGEKIYSYENKGSIGNSELLTQKEIDWRKTKEERDSNENITTIIIGIFIIVIVIAVISSYLK